MFLNDPTRAQAEQALYEAGEAHGYLVKAGGAPTSVYALKGRLYLSSSGWLLLDVPNALVRGLFSALSVPGAELPPARGAFYNAHISVMDAGETAQIGPENINERGSFFSYQLGPIQEVEPAGWKEMAKCYFVRIISPELKALRQSYGLSPLHKGHDFHVTVAVRRKGVLANNSVSKAAAVDVPHHEQETADSCGAAALSMTNGVPERQVRCEAGTDDGGTSPVDLLRNAARHGQRPVAAHGASVSELAASTLLGRPAITPIQMHGTPREEARGDAGHYVVVEGVRRGRVHLDDPAAAHGDSHMAVGDFLARWHDTDKHGEPYHRFALEVDPTSKAASFPAEKHDTMTPGARAFAAIAALFPGEDLLAGGEADGMPASAFDPRALRKGERHEREHTILPQIAKETAEDHLCEQPDYYDKLQKLEGEDITDNLAKAAKAHRHFRAKCRCGAVVAECRCEDDDKRTFTVERPCGACRAHEKDAADGDSPIDVLQHWAPPIGDPYATLDGFAERFSREPINAALLNTVGTSLAGAAVGGLTGTLAGSAKRPPQMARTALHHAAIGGGAGLGFGLGSVLGDTAAGSIENPTAKLLVQSAGRLGGAGLGALGGHLLTEPAKEHKKQADATTGLGRLGQVAGDSISQAAGTVYKHLPRIRAFDSVVGSGTGALAGLGVDVARNTVDDWQRGTQPLTRREQKDRQNRRATSVLGGAALGFGAGNLIGDRSRRWVANNMIPFNYSGGLEQVTPKSLGHLYRGAVLDQPVHRESMPAKYDRIKATLGEDFDRQMSTRYELGRRQFGVHTPDPAKDMLVDNSDSTVSMNPANPEAMKFMQRSMAGVAGGSPAESRLFKDPAGLLKEVNSTGGVVTPALFGQSVVGGQQIPNATDSKGNIHARTLDRYDVSLDPPDREYQIGAVARGDLLRKEWRDAPSMARLSTYMNPDIPNPETGKPYTNWETWRTLGMRDFMDNVIAYKNPWFSQRMVFQPQSAGGYAVQPLSEQGMPLGQPITEKSPL